jgi:hypothetical protein
MMSVTNQLTTAIVISLVAGILIILGSLYTTMWGMGGGYGWMMGGLGGMMGQRAYGAMAGVWILGLGSGIIVLISAIMLKVRPGEAERGLRTCCTWWGSIILVFSIVSLFGGSLGGFLVGAILGIVGGALALWTGLRVDTNSSSGGTDARSAHEVG